MSNNVRKQHIGNIPVGFWRETAVCRSWSFSRWYRPRTGLVWLRSHRTRDCSRCARPSYLSNSTKRRKHSCRLHTTRVVVPRGGGRVSGIQGVYPTLFQIPLLIPYPTPRYPPQRPYPQIPYPPLHTPPLWIPYPSRQIPYPPRDTLPPWIP